MDILLYLTELLQTRKTVGIAGLGTLYKKKSPGKYDADKHAFVPPSYTIAFTTELKEQEELANFISAKRNITLDSANYYIGEFSDKIHAELADKYEADLEPIGKLKLVNDEITFIREQESNFGFDFFGLPTLTELNSESELKDNSAPVEENTIEEIEEENKLEEENPGQETTDNLDDQPVYDEIGEFESPIEVHKNTNPPIIETTEEEEKEDELNEVETEELFEEETEPKKGLPFFMKFLIVLLIIIAAGAIAYFINPPFFDNYIKNNFEGKQDKNVPTALNDSLKNKLDSSQLDSVAKNNALVKLTTDSAAKAIDSSKVTIYEVLVSAVATEKKANKIISNLATQGVNAKKVKLSKTMINISAGSFLTNEEALKYRDSLRTKLRNPGIYIQPITPKTHKK
ncbi:HU domain-containing protein [Pedobacter boryungensis]|uniref:SPOR domain-containing protein n=1 Tax=Pedobacter boryungensis TaxID=869962 RepID=A0ABX2DGJ6_9SPHI|nr:SPOR domain-containing protein [Pedobacter boryungensis]NQX33060.1 SPOR domain-containing protein [Pedobacter boryungensis]